MFIKRSLYALALSCMALSCSLFGAAVSYTKSLVWAAERSVPFQQWLKGAIIRESDAFLQSSLIAFVMNHGEKIGVECGKAVLYYVVKKGIDMIEKAMSSSMPSELEVVSEKEHFEKYSISCAIELLLKKGIPVTPHITNHVQETVDSYQQEIDSVDDSDSNKEQYRASKAAIENFYKTVQESSIVRELPVEHEVEKKEA